jgi:hypothetical protein
MIGPLSVQIALYRLKAKELRARAGCVRDPRTTGGFLRLADEYDRLAVHAEDWSAATATLLVELTSPPDDETHLPSKPRPRILPK